MKWIVIGILLIAVYYMSQAHPHEKCVRFGPVAICGDQQ